jgi:osmotically-inducible protein OsmY
MPKLLFQRPHSRAARPLSDTVRSVLRDSGYGDLQGIAVSESSGSVRLDGVVRTFYVKQQAQTLAMSVDGVTRLENEVVVA